MREELLAEEDIFSAFRKCPKADMQTGIDILPDVMQLAEDIARTQGVATTWPLVSMAAMMGLLRCALAVDAKH